MNVNRNAMLQRKGIETAMFLSIAAGQVSLLSYWLVCVIGALFGIAQRLSNCAGHKKISSMQMSFSTRLNYITCVCVEGKGG
jgi:hypothetical protein